MPPPLQKKCSECHREFTTNYPTTKVCGPTCRRTRRNRKRRKNKVWRPPRHTFPCTICGEKIPKSRGGKAWTCSPECSRESVRRRKAWERYEKANERITNSLRKCAECGLYFLARRPHRIVCSLQCSAKRKRKKGRERYKRITPHKVIPKLRTEKCEECHQPFTTKNSRQVTCGKHCSEKRHSEKKRKLYQSKKYPVIV